MTSLSHRNRPSILVNVPSQQIGLTRLPLYLAGSEPHDSHSPPLIGSLDRDFLSCHIVENSAYFERKLVKCTEWDFDFVLDGN